MGCNDNGGRIIPSPCGCNSDFDLRRSNCSCGGKGCSNCRCDSRQQASPTPYYNKAGACQENHDRLLINERYSASIKITTGFTVCAGNTVSVVSPNLENIVIGSYLWTPIAGDPAGAYLQVTGFDVASSLLVVKNFGASGCLTFAPCTSFVVVDAPPVVGSGPSSEFPFLAVSISAAPACGDCLPITVTNTNGLIVDGNIQILSGVYRVSAITDATHITICNDVVPTTPPPACMGLLVNTPVVAQDSNGNYVVPIVPIATNPCLNTAVATGTLIVCKNGAAQPLSSSIQGQVPVSNSDGTVTMQALDLPTVYCSPIDVCCLNILIGVTNYTISVHSNAGFSVGQIIQFNYTSIVTLRATVTNVDVDTHHISFTLTTTPGANVDVPNGTSICVATCCEQIYSLFTPCNGTFQAAVNAVQRADSTSAQTLKVSVTPQLVHGTTETLYTDGGTIDQWSYVDLVNDTCTNVRVAITATYWAQVYLATLGIFNAMSYRFIPDYSYEAIPIANSFAQAWLAPGTTGYTEVEPTIRMEPLPLFTGSFPGDIVGNDFPLSVFTQEHVVAAHFKLRIAIRPNLTIDYVANTAGDQLNVAKLGSRILAIMNTVS